MSTQSYAILSDFDGTIANPDVLNSALKLLGDPEWRVIEDQFLRREIGSREALKLQMKQLKITKHELLDFVKTQVTVDPHFPKFAQRVQKKGIPLIVLSEGLEFYIRDIFNAINLSWVEVKANQLQWSDDERIDHSTLIFPCTRPKSVEYNPGRGECGNCKTHTLHLIRQQNPHQIIVYIGDGETDLCPSMYADLVFAKLGSHLHKSCKEKGIKCTAFTTFDDIITKLLL